MKCRLSMWEKRRNTDIRSTANMETVESMVRKNRLRWLGHLGSHVCHDSSWYREENVHQVDSSWGGMTLWLEIWRCHWTRGSLLRTAVSGEALRSGGRRQKAGEAGGWEEEERGSNNWVHMACEVAGCHFSAQRKAGLVNHHRQTHGSQAQNDLHMSDWWEPL